VPTGGARWRVVAWWGAAVAGGGSRRDARAWEEGGRGGLESAREVEGVLHALAIGRRFTDGGGLRRPAGGGKRRRCSGGARVSRGRGDDVFEWEGRGESGRPRGSSRAGRSTLAQLAAASVRCRAGAQRAWAKARETRRKGLTQSYMRQDQVMHIYNRIIKISQHVSQNKSV
jgi:hypothetical protein